ncbi:hypothetical protein [Bacillus thuringiensis]|uniref:hypothetical protein n=1 Tax=Bacillus thuringiensis TaxID=1428 RepID=UPI00211D32E8|nr:hypothetical protein [Bacillus thuringiensis]
MLDKIMIEFIKVKHRITHIIDSKCNWITTIKNNEVYVEREFGIEEGLDLEFSVNGEEIQEIWRDLINVQLVNVNDFVRQEERNAFLISLFAELPFVKVTTINGERAITFKEFKTDNLPSEKYDKVMLFLEEIMNIKWICQQTKKKPKPLIHKDLSLV